MQSSGVAVIAMLVASASYAASYVFQHKGTQATMGVGAAAGGVKRLLRNKFWLIGVGLFSLGFWLHMVALALGSVAVVQPLIVTELIFIPPLSALISKTKVSALEWVAILAVAGGLAGFLIVANPSAGTSTPSSEQWVGVIVGSVAVVGVLTVIGSRFTSTARAATLGVAAGLVNALMAITAKGALADPSPAALVANPLTYVTVVAAFATFASTAYAFRSGPITVSSPSIIAANPFAATLVSIWLFQEDLNTTPIDLTLIAISLAVTIAGVVYLSRAEARLAEAEPMLATEMPQ